MFIMAFRALVLSMLLGLGQASLDPRALGGQQSTSSSTTPTPSPTSQTSAPSSTSASAPATSSTAGSQGGGGGPTSSPLLFFVALGFGVVFTNLWIIVGVKYCFRYNQRHRQGRPDEIGEPIDLATMRRPGRRRREKKLMSMEEVNERFPLTKYKTWVASRESEGLPKTGGITAPPSRAGSVRDVDGSVRRSKDISSDDLVQPGTAVSTSECVEIGSPAAAESGQRKSGEARHSMVAEGIAHLPTLEETKTSESTIPDPPNAAAHPEEEEEEEEDDHIHTAVPPELLTNPGDSCAICLDNLDDDDDVRGLTCGHAFHASCLDPWLTSRRACCPLCKADYYVPKPRPEGETAADAERSTRTRNHGGSRTRGPLPAVPQSSWNGSRGSTFHSRMILPSRFVPNHYAEHDRYGFPVVQRDRRRRQQQESGPAEVSYTADPNAPNTSGTGRRILPRFSNPFNRGSTNERNPPNAEVSYTAENSTSTETNARGWRPRVANPFTGGWMARRSNRPEENTTSAEVQDGTSPTPGQLEAAVR